MSHLSGIRHYEKVKSDNGKPTDATESAKQDLENSAKKKQEKDEFERKEYLINAYYESVAKSLSLFQHDELHHSPGITVILPL